MLSRRIDTALDAIVRCRSQVPLLSGLYRPGSPERTALDELAEVLGRADAALFHRPAPPPVGWRLD